MEVTDSPFAPTPYEIGGRMKAMTCLEGQQHRWTDRSRCERCRAYKDEVRTYCGPWACDDFEKVCTWTRTVAPNYPDWESGQGLAYEERSDRGACDWCIEKYQRDEARSVRAADLTIKAWHDLLRWKRNIEAFKEREIQWRLERQAREERDRQRTALRQGRQTMVAIRRVLHGQDPLPPQESTPARSSQT